MAKVRYVKDDGTEYTCLGIATVTCDNGTARICVRDHRFDRYFAVAVFTDDGKLELLANLPIDCGLDLDGAGRIKIKIEKDD